MPTCIDILMARLLEIQDDPSHGDEAYALEWVIKKIQEQDENPVPFVIYSTGDRGYPFIEHDEYGRGRLLLVRSHSASDPIQVHGVNP